MRNRSLARIFGLRSWLSPDVRHQWPDLSDDIRLTGDQIELRWPNAADAAAVFAYASDPEVSRYMDWATHRNADESLRFIRTLEKSRSIRREAAFAIVERATDEMIGICSLVSQSETNVCELGYALQRKAWGRGIMTEAVSIISSWGTGVLGLTEIFAEVHPSNLASQRVLEKNRFNKHADMVNRRIKGIQTPHYHYHILREGRCQRDRMRFSERI
jgi:ribosomal-protein-alanine N-acetyltransferase